MIIIIVVVIVINNTTTTTTTTNTSTNTNTNAYATTNNGNNNNHANHNTDNDDIDIDSNNSNNDQFHDSDIMNDKINNCHNITNTWLVIISSILYSINNAIMMIYVHVIINRIINDNDQYHKDLQLAIIAGDRVNLEDREFFAVNYSHS